MISPFTLITASLFIFFSVLIWAALFFRHQRMLIYSVFSLTSVASLLALIADIWTVRYGITESYIILMGLPDLPFHLRLDPLSGFFLTVIGSLGFIVSIYSIGYVKGFIGHRPVTHGHVKVAGDVPKAVIAEARGVDLSDAHERMALFLPPFLRNPRVSPRGRNPAAL